MMRAMYWRESAGFYVAESEDDAAALLVKQIGCDPSEATGFVRIPDAQVIPVRDVDTNATTKKTAREWVEGAEFKGYIFGGDE